MTFRKHPSKIGLVFLLSLTAYSCSLPFFGKGQDNAQGGAAGPGLPARLSGVIDRGEGCQPGYYQVKLTGLFEGGQNQVEAQSDQNGRFSITAPPGHYLVSVGKDGCGFKQSIELEENTEHMISIAVTEMKAVERVIRSEDRLPASILVSPSSK